MAKKQRTEEQETSLDDISWKEVEWDKLKVIAVHYYYPEDTDDGQVKDTTH